MKLERAGKNIVMAEVLGMDVIHCDILTPMAVERIVQNNNFGEEVANLYFQYRNGSTSLKNTVALLDEIDKLHMQYSAALRSARSGITITEAM